MTREEYQNDWDIKCKLFEAIAISHPAQLQQFDETFSFLSKIKTYAHLRYWNSQLGQDLWKSIKHWHNMKSGPEVNLLHLEFVALFMASSIWVQHNLSNSSLPKPSLVPLPSSPYSSSSPARVSNRLARRIAQLTELPFMEIFEKQNDKIIFVGSKGIELDSIILIDDQLTMGNTAEKCLAKIVGHIQNIELRVWTSKKFTFNSPERLISDYLVTEIDFKVLGPPQVETENRVPQPGQRVHTSRFGLGQIKEIRTDWMIIDFKGLGKYRYRIGSSEIDFLD
jgi:hypothetical protein